MKKINHFITFLAGILFTILIAWSDNSQNQKSTVAPDSNRILAIRKIKLKEGVTEAAIEKFAIRVANDEFGILPGVRLYCGKGERGDEPGTYVLFMDFDSKTTRNFYSPEEGKQDGMEIKRSAEAEKMVNALFSKYTPEFNKLAEVIIPSGKKGYVDYIILK